MASESELAFTPVHHYHLHSSGSTYNFINKLVYFAVANGNTYDLILQIFRKNIFKKYITFKIAVSQNIFD